MAFTPREIIEPFCRLLYTNRRRGELDAALPHFIRAIELTGRRSADALDALPAAYGAAGEFARAVAIIQEALDVGTGEKAAMRARKKLSPVVSPTGSSEAPVSGRPS